MRTPRTKTWLQYPAAPSTRSEVLPVCATALSIVAVPAPLQSGYTTVQSPAGAPAAWFSKPSQISVGTHEAGGLVDGGIVDGGGLEGGIVDGGIVDGGIVDGAVVDGGVDGALPLQDTPLTAKSDGLA